MLLTDCYKLNGVGLNQKLQNLSSFLMLLLGFSFWSRKKFGGQIPKFSGEIMEFGHLISQLSFLGHFWREMGVATTSPHAPYGMRPPNPTKSWPTSCVNCYLEIMFSKCSPPP